MKKFIVLLVTLSGLITAAQSQTGNPYVAAADKYFAAGDYFSAAEYYETYLNGGKSKKAQAAAFNPYVVTEASSKKVTVTSTSKEKVIYNLAECYRKLHYPDKAATLYQQATSFNKAEFPLATFHYASTLRAQGKYDESLAAFQVFKESYPEKDSYAKIAAMEIENLQFVKTQMARKNLDAYKIQKNTALNAAEGGSYAPTWVNENTLWFTSTRAQGDSKTGANHNRVYQSTYANGNAGTVSLTNIPQPSDMQQGVTSLTPDGNTLFLTRWTKTRSSKTSGIYISKKSGDTWSEPTLVSRLEMTGVNNQEPFVMPNGNALVFSSDRPDGAGGFDLWVASLDQDGSVGVPVNMGANINTALDERAPSYHNASNTFVFSSNGRVGMGGFDFYFAKGTLDQLSAPKNFGYPVNSVKDDLYFTSKGPARNILEDVVLSSDREAACCLELFSLSKPKPIKQLSGTVLDCKNNQPMANVKVVIMDTINNRQLTELTTDASGKYNFTVEDYLPLKAMASNSGYFNNSVHFNGPADEEEAAFQSPDLCLTQIPETPEETVEVKNVYYDFNSASLQKTSYASLDNLAQLLKDNPNLQIELDAHTDSKGEEDYNQKLSDARANAVVAYLVKKGIDPSRLVAKGFGESMPVAENTNPDGTDNPDGRQLNRRTEFKVLKK